MNHAQFIDELRVRSGMVSILADQVQQDVRAAQRLDDGDLLVPPNADRDMVDLIGAVDSLWDLLSESSPQAL